MSDSSKTPAPVPATFDVRTRFKVMKRYAAELQRIDPAAYVHWIGQEGLRGLLLRFPELRINGLTFREACVEAEKARQARPKTTLNAGDFVEITGRVFRIGSVRSDGDEVVTERLDDKGKVLSSSPCLAHYPDETPLLPLLAWKPDENPWPPYPPGMVDGYARARFVRSKHVQHLVAAGLDDED